MFRWILKRLSGYSPAYDRDQLISVVATLIFIISTIGLNIFFLFVHFKIPELRTMNIISILLAISAMYLILIKYKYVFTCYLITISQCYYILYSTYILGYEKDGVLLFPVLIFAIHSILKIRTKHIKRITRIVMVAFLCSLYLKFFNHAEYEGQLMYTEYINIIFAVAFCKFIIEAKGIAERFVDKYSKNEITGISKEAYQDYLTGLWNRRFMEREFSKMNKLTEGVLVLADIDLFKKVNDTYGHNTGDYVLKKVSEMYRHNLRDCDVICRWGGEEFLFYIKNVSEESAIHTVEKIREKIEKTHFTFEEHKFSVTVSFGVTKVDGSIDILENIDRADLLLLLFLLHLRPSLSSPFSPALSPPPRFP